MKSQNRNNPNSQKTMIDNFLLAMKAILLTVLTFCPWSALPAQTNGEQSARADQGETFLVNIAETDGATVLQEDGATSDSCFITLKRKPTAEVIISLIVAAKQIQIGPEPTDTFRLIFTRKNWQNKQVVRLKALDDSVMERLKYATIALASKSRDPNYNNAVLPVLNVRILDNDGIHRQSDGYSIPIVDLDQNFRQVIVDRRPGVYLGHPTTTLLADQKTIMTVYPTGHGQGAIQYKRSSDGGKSWSESLPTPESWQSSKEVPTLFRMTDASAKERLILFSGLYPARRAFSEDNGTTWSELEAVGDWGGIVVMAGAIRLKDGRYLAMFHDDGRFFTGSMKRSNFRVFKTYSDDGGLTWSFPEVVIDCDWADPCEPGIFRSPDGNQILVLLRENSRRFNSLMITSEDEGKTWSHLRELPAALTGDRHTGVYTADGRLFISFRDLSHDSPTQGDWVGWVGTYDDIIHGREGQYRIRLKDNLKDADCAYPGVEILPDSTIVTTTYGHWISGEQPYIVSTRFKLAEIDKQFK